MAKVESPKSVEDKLNRVAEAWATLAPDASFYGMTLAQFKAKIKPSFDERAELKRLDDLVIAALKSRATADDVSLTALQNVVSSVVGSPDYGDNSDLYAAMGYIRKDDRASGLTRKKKPPTP